MVMEGRLSTGYPHFLLVHFLLRVKHGFWPGSWATPHGKAACRVRTRQLVRAVLRLRTAECAAQPALQRHCV